MKQYILKNDTQENVSARVTVTPSDELNNLGHEGATVIEGDRLTTCLSPTVNEMLPPVSHRSACFELSEEGRYAVEINGVIVPFAFSTDQLIEYFDGNNIEGVTFQPCEDFCSGAMEMAGDVSAVAGLWKLEIDDVEITPTAKTIDEITTLAPSQKFGITYNPPEDEYPAAYSFINYDIFKGKHIFLRGDVGSVANVESADTYGTIRKVGNDVEVCLAACQVGQPVEGAVNSVVFTSSDGITSSGYNIDVNCERNWVTMRPDHSLLVDQIEQVYFDRLAINVTENGGVFTWVITSLHPELLKIQLSQRTSLANFDISPDNDNPTIITQLGGYSFTLAPPTEI